jgi:hypothetical protein
MEAKTEHSHLDSNFTFRDRSHSPLTVRAVTLTLTRENDEIIECRLSFKVNPELYQRIDTDPLFNLKPEVRSPLTNGDFQPQPDIQIEASLKPDLLPRLLERASNVSEASAYLLSLSQQQPESGLESTGPESETVETDDKGEFTQDVDPHANPLNEPAFTNPKSPDFLLATENWLGLSVKQSHESGETGYRTFWSYVSPKTLSGSAPSGEEINHSLTNFFNDLLGSSLEQAAKELTTKTFGGLANFFQELAENTQDSTPQDTANKQPIFEAMVNFFREDDWPFVKVEGEPALRLAFEGENGKWNCYAKARVQQQQMVFYSICPVFAPEAKRGAVAEFIARANYGMIIGNLEMDFEDGEIRYKTSIDVEGDSLSSALIKQLVYANVMMMDQYLPGIMSVIDSDVSPKDALAKIENQPE